MENDPSARDELKALGLRAVPVTLVGDKAIVGFNRTELTRALGIRAQADEARDTGWLYTKYQVILPAAVRATRQVPDDKLEWHGAERERTLRQFTYHLFDRPLAAVQAYESGRYTQKDARRYEEEARAYPTAEAIAQFGEQTIAYINEFLKKTTPHDLQRPVDSYSGPTTVGQLIDMALGHTTHHLRQLYHYLDQVGVKPEGPLTEKDFRDINVPTELF